MKRYRPEQRPTPGAFASAPLSWQRGQLAARRRAAAVSTQSEEVIFQAATTSTTLLLCGYCVTSLCDVRVRVPLRSPPGAAAAHGARAGEPGARQPGAGGAVGGGGRGRDAAGEILPLPRWRERER
jgi:hypothetical protein